MRNVTILCCVVLYFQLWPFELGSFLGLCRLARLNHINNSQIHELIPNSPYGPRNTLIITEEVTNKVSYDVGVISLNYTVSLERFTVTTPRVWRVSTFTNCHNEPAGIRRKSTPSLSTGFDKGGALTLNVLSRLLEDISVVCRSVLAWGAELRVRRHSVQGGRTFLIVVLDRHHIS
ncbi:hypothetical protein IF2G_00948 [Cordyceps javanica]|nr:hypothetical protein IF2G_00948 [Cordyceps javanica]